MNLRKDNIPEGLEPLIPLVKKWGLGDDYCRENKVALASTLELEELIKCLERIDEDKLFTWLTGPAADNDPLSQEYVAFTNFTMAIDSARVRLDRHAKGWE